MKIGVNKVAGVMVIVSLLGLLMFPSLTEAIPVIVQTTGQGQFTPSTTTCCDSGGGNITNPFTSSWTVTVLVTNPRDGTPISNLGSSQSGVPAGWSSGLFLTPSSSGFSSCPGTSFTNGGNGVYFISFSFSSLPGPSCPGVLGSHSEVDYVIEININISGTTFIGSGLGALTIP
jgi:hypothetical protein